MIKFDDLNLKIPVVLAFLIFLRVLVACSADLSLKKVE